MAVTVTVATPTGGQEIHLYENATKYRYNSQSETFELFAGNGRTPIAIYSKHTVFRLSFEDPKVLDSSKPRSSVKLD